MKLRHMTLTVVSIFALFLTNAQAGNKQVGGLILGGGTGAIVGHAVGRSAESTIVGAAVGGAVGIIIGSELEKHHRSDNRHSQVVIYSPSHKPRRGHEFRGHYHDYPRYRHGKEHYRKTVIVEKGHRKTKRIVTTVRDNGHWSHSRTKRNDNHNPRYYH